MVAMSLGTTEWILAPVVGALVACISVLAWAETAIGRTLPAALGRAATNSRSARAPASLSSRRS